MSYKYYNKNFMITEEQKARYELAFHLSPEAIVILDKKGSMLDANDRLYDWTGYKPAEVMGKNLLMLPFLTNEGRMNAIKNFTKRMLGKPVEPYILDFIHKKDGSVIHGRVNASVIKDKNGKSLYDLVLISNVTEEMNLAEQLKERAEQLETMNKLMVDRELAMVKLKQRINELENK